MQMGIKMFDYKKEIDNLIQIIDEIVILILQGKIAAPKKLLPELMNQVGKVFPEIIMSYAQPEFSAVSNDYEYWKNQLNRIAEIITCEDQFLIIDILNFETKDSLTTYKNMRMAHESANI
jgi:hypothetical protein